MIVLAVASVFIGEFTIILIFGVPVVVGFIISRKSPGYGILANLFFYALLLGVTSLGAAGLFGHSESLGYAVFGMLIAFPFFVVGTVIWCFISYGIWKLIDKGKTVRKTRRTARKR